MVFDEIMFGSVPAVEGEAVAISCSGDLQEVSVNESVIDFD